MLVLGIDPGTATTGFGLVRENNLNELEVVDFGILTTAAGKPLESRLLDLYLAIIEVLGRYQPENAAVEKLFFQKNVKTALAVGHARGVLLLALAEKKITVAEYTPLEVKQAVVGYGAADKKQVQEMVKALLRLKTIPKPDDAADALAIAICHLNSYRLRNLANESP